MTKAPPVKPRVEVQNILCANKPHDKEANKRSPGAKTYLTDLNTDKKPPPKGANIRRVNLEIKYSVLEAKGMLQVSGWLTMYSITQTHPWCVCCASPYSLKYISSHVVSEAMDRSLKAYYWCGSVCKLGWILDQPGTVQRFAQFGIS